MSLKIEKLVEINKILINLISVFKFIRSNRKCFIEEEEGVLEKDSSEKDLENSSKEKEISPIEAESDYSLQYSMEL